MKFLYILYFSYFFLMFNSCGLLDSGGGMHGYQEHNINKLYAINLVDGNIKFLTFGSHFYISKDGKIFYLNNDRLHSCNVDGTDTLNVLSDNKPVYSYQISADGTKIIFERYPSIFVMNSDGSELSQLNLHDDVNRWFSFVYSPINHKIAYTNNTGLYIMNDDGIDSKMLRDTSFNSFFPHISFSADGHNLIYIQDQQYKYTRDLRLYNLDNMQDNSLYSSNTPDVVISFSISQANNLLFCNDVGIDLQNLNTYGFNQIYSGGGDAHFSYDTTKITFIDFSKNSIGIIDLNNRTVHLFPINLPKNSISGPTLTSNGKSIIFEADSTWSTLINKK